MSSVINVRVEECTKQDVEILFNQLGMTINTAVNIFFKQSLMENALPFQPKITYKKKKTYNVKRTFKRF